MSFACSLHQACYYIHEEGVDLCAHPRSLDYCGKRWGDFAAGELLSHTALAKDAGTGPVAVLETSCEGLDH